MISFPNAKINIGLKVVEKRSDGFHNIESIFYPIDLCDVLEVIPHPKNKGRGVCDFTSSGLEISGSIENNLCVKAYHILDADFNLPAVQIHLHKIIPMGAGLGGGSADATFVLKSLNTLFKLDLTNEQLENYASRLGADCPFFVENKPAYVTGTGNVFEPVDLDVSNYHFVLVNPNVHVGTVEAYAGITPQASKLDLQTMITQPIETWDEKCNDFETYVFKAHPKAAQVKQQLKNLGADFTSMTGSGSTVYAFFKNKPDLTGLFEDCFVFNISCC